MPQPSSPPFTLFQRKGTKNWSVRFGMQGKQIRKSLETDDRVDAERRAYEIWAEASYRTKNGLNVTAMPFAKLADRFIEQILLEIQRGERSHHHGRDWPPVIRRYLVGFFGERPIDGIGEPDLERYVEWRRQYWITGPGKALAHIHYERGGRALKRSVKREVPSLSRQRGELVIVRALFQQATKWGYVRAIEIPTIKVRRRVDNRRPSFEPHEFENLIQTSLDRLVDPIMLGGSERMVSAKEVVSGGYPNWMTTRAAIESPCTATSRSQRPRVCGPRRARTSTGATFSTTERSGSCPSATVTSGSG
jgi:hypothetical protein